MTDDTNYPARRSVRLIDYDYREPARYFVTICTHGKSCVLGSVHEGKVELTTLGQVARHFWLALPRMFGHIELDEFEVMPNHLHGIIVIGEQSRAKEWDGGNNSTAEPDRPHSFAPTVAAYAGRPKGTRPGSLAAIVQTFKSISTRRANKITHTPGASLWQRNYYEHVIRNEEALCEIRQYIVANPWMWPKDKYFHG